tara:strand:+ start:1999 stop:2304 length:306 start_codon:yes stop_codon:yes gene_type:complete
MKNKIHMVGAIGYEIQSEITPVKIEYKYLVDGYIEIEADYISDSVSIYDYNNFSDKDKLKFRQNMKLKIIEEVNSYHSIYEMKIAHTQEDVFNNEGDVEIK